MMHVNVDNLRGQWGTGAVTEGAGARGSSSGPQTVKSWENGGIDSNIEELCPLDVEELGCCQHQNDTPGRMQHL